MLVYYNIGWTPFTVLLLNVQLSRPTVLQVLLFCEGIFFKVSFKTSLCTEFCFWMHLLCGSSLKSLSPSLVQRHCCDNMFLWTSLGGFLSEAPLLCESCLQTYCKPSYVQLFANVLSKTHRLHVREHLLQGSSCTELLFARPILLQYPTRAPLPLFCKTFVW